MKQTGEKQTHIMISDRYIEETCDFITKSVFEDQFKPWSVRKIKMLAYFGLGLSITAAYLLPRVDLVIDSVLRKKLGKKNG